MRQILIFILALTANLAVAQQNIEKITIPIMGFLLHQKKS